MVGKGRKERRKVARPDGWRWRRRAGGKVCELAAETDGRVESATRGSRRGAAGSVEEAVMGCGADGDAPRLQ